MKWITPKQLPPDIFMPYTFETEERDSHVEALILRLLGKPVLKIQEVYGTLRVLVPGEPELSAEPESIG